MYVFLISVCVSMGLRSVSRYCISPNLYRHKQSWDNDAIPTVICVKSSHLIILLFCAYMHLVRLVFGYQNKSNCTHLKDMMS